MSVSIETTLDLDIECSNCGKEVDIYQDRYGKITVNECDCYINEKKELQDKIDDLLSEKDDLDDELAKLKDRFGV